jgi:hypothetical protein
MKPGIGKQAEMLWERRTGEEVVAGWILPLGLPPNNRLNARKFRIKMLPLLPDPVLNPKGRPLALDAQ